MHDCDIDPQRKDEIRAGQQSLAHRCCAIVWCEARRDSVARSRRSTTVSPGLRTFRPLGRGSAPQTERESRSPVGWHVAGHRRVGGSPMLHVKRRAFIALIGAAAIAWPLAAALLAAGISAIGARITQDSMSQPPGQQIVIENIGGAGGMTAAGRAARAAPDGYTVLLHQVALAAGMTLYPNLAFDAEKDFIPIGLINTAASTLAARPTLPPNDIAGLGRWLKGPRQNAT